MSRGTRENLCDVSFPPDPPIVARPQNSRWVWVWRVTRLVVAAAAVGAAVWAISGKTDELQGATGYLANIRWWWLAIAVVAEGTCYLALSTLQRRLLWAGRVQVPVLQMFGITLAGSAIQNSLPGGSVFYAAYTFRQYRRYGADDLLAGWTVVASNAVTFVSLAAIAAVGLGMALSAGNAFDLVESILIIFLAAGLLVGIWTQRARLIPYVVKAVRLSQTVIKRPRRGVSPDEVVADLIAEIGMVSPSRGDWTRAGVLGLANWMADLSCLALSFMAVGAGVPWRGLLLAYCAGQLASILPVTPGGLGVVEGSLTVALVTFGGGQDSTVAAVLLYRLISFWLVLPIGWSSWIVLALRGRSHSVSTEGAIA